MPSAFRSTAGASWRMVLLAMALDAAEGCAPDAPPAPASRDPDHRALDTIAAWKSPITAEFYHQLRGWAFGLGETAVLAAGTRTITTFSPEGAASVAFDAGEGGVISMAADGSRIGLMRRDAELVVGFEMRAQDGRVIWSHGPQGHHYYQVGPGGRLTIGHSASTAHPGKPGTVGTLIFYDSLGAARGRFACGQQASVEIAPDAGAVLVTCRDSVLAAVAPSGRALLTLPGSFRNARIAAGGRVVAAVPVEDPRTLAIATLDSAGGAGRAIRVELAAPIRQVALTDDGRLAVVTSRSEVIGVTPADGRVTWRVTLEGARAITALALSPEGLVAVGARRGESPAASGAPGPHPVLVAILRDGKRLSRIDFELGRLNAWTPSVALAPDEGRLLAWGVTEVWSIPATRWAGR